MAITDPSDYRRQIYGFTRTMRRAQISAHARDLCHELLSRRGTPEQMAGWRGEVMAVMIEAQAALERLDAGAPR